MTNTITKETISQAFYYNPLPNPDTYSKNYTSSELYAFQAGWQNAVQTLAHYVQMNIDDVCETDSTTIDPITLAVYHQVNETIYNRVEDILHEKRKADSKDNDQVLIYQGLIYHIEVGNESVNVTTFKEYLDDRPDQYFTYQFPASYLTNEHYVEDIKAAAEKRKQALKEIEDKRKQEQDAMDEEHDRSEYERLRRKFENKKEDTVS